MSGKARPSLRAKTLLNVDYSNLSMTDKKCIHAVFELAEKKSEGEWISVEDRLPEKGGYYLIYQKSSLWIDEVIQTARWNISAQKFRGSQAGCFMEYVTHWMPLPDAPKKGERDG